MKIKNVFVLSDILVLAAILAAGCLLFLFGQGWRAIGICVVACGLCMCPFFRHGYKIDGVSGVFRVQDIPVSRENEAAIVSFLNKQIPELNIGPHIQGGALVSVYTRKGCDETYAQYYDYAKILSGECHPVVRITSQQRDELIKYNLKAKK